MSARTLFVSGTDTGVGKTRVTEALATLAGETGAAVVAAKPVESGWTDGPESDARRLQRASNVSLELDETNLYRLAAPVAPWLAAELEERSIDVLRLFTAMRALESRCDWLLVEGAGGIYVPLSESVSYLEWVGLLGYPVLVVARSQLGTINHTLLTLSALERAKIPVVGVLLNRTSPDGGPDEPHNKRLIEARSDVPIFGPTAYCGVSQPLAADAEMIRCFEAIEAELAQRPRTSR
ncbi:MAG: dethiobiotin synthase, partial [Myxococcales bacterium]|nr:dethiobiotin synthase [Myxococcales bacterium]